MNLMSATLDWSNLDNFSFVREKTNKQMIITLNLEISFGILNLYPNKS